MRARKPLRRSASLKRQKKSLLVVRCTEEQLADWHGYSNAQGLELSSWVRMVLTREIRQARDATGEGGS
jgi:hypothetical protein